jgi:hypothetical protein
MVATQYPELTEEQMSTLTVLALRHVALVIARKVTFENHDAKRDEALMKCKLDIHNSNAIEYYETSIKIISLGCITAKSVYQESR